MENTTENIKTTTENINKFVEIVNTVVRKNYETRYPNLDIPVYQIQVAKKYVKVWEYAHGERRSIHSFINPQTGEIFMPASCNAPAKHARGNINSPTNGLEAIDATRGNVLYLRG